MIFSASYLYNCSFLALSLLCFLSCRIILCLFSIVQQCGGSICLSNIFIILVTHVQLVLVTRWIETMKWFFLMEPKVYQSRWHLIVQTDVLTRIQEFSQPIYPRIYQSISFCHYFSRVLPTYLSMNAGKTVISKFYYVLLLV